MCDFCHQHGEGKKWYRQAKNYSADLLSDPRRRKFITEFVTNLAPLRRTPADLERFARLPGFVRRAVSAIVSRRMRRIHFGQVVPIEELERIFGFANSVVRLNCACRHAALGGEHRYCYGVSLEAGGGRMAELIRGLKDCFLTAPDTAGLEVRTGAEALAEMRALEKEGCCHTIWTFHAPFIGGICNCDRADCLAMRATVTHGMPVMFRAEYVAAIDPDRCTGCRQCLRVCQFGALTFSAANRKTEVDPRRCYGCGICRAVCPAAAIALPDRAAVPAAAGLW